MADRFDFAALLVEGRDQLILGALDDLDDRSKSDSPKTGATRSGSKTEVHRATTAWRRVEAARWFDVFMALSPTGCRPLSIVRVGGRVRTRFVFECILVTLPPTL